MQRPGVARHPIWIAPRDITPGTDWSGATVDAIARCRAVVLVSTAQANVSPQVKREIERAASRGLPILPLRLEDVPLSKHMEFFISTPHWLDALTPPVEAHIQRLAKTVTTLLADGGDRQPAASSTTISPVPTSAARPNLSRRGLHLFAAAALPLRQSRCGEVSDRLRLAGPPIGGSIW